MNKTEYIKFSPEEVQERIASDYRPEYKYIEKYGDNARKTILQMASSTETIHSEKLNKDLKLECSLVREKKMRMDLFPLALLYTKFKFLMASKNSHSVYTSLNLQVFIYHLSG